MPFVSHRPGAYGRLLLAGYVQWKIAGVFGLVQTGGTGRLEGGPSGPGARSGPNTRSGRDQLTRRPAI